MFLDEVHENQVIGDVADEDVQFICICVCIITSFNILLHFLGRLNIQSLSSGNKTGDK